MVRFVLRLLVRGSGVCVLASRDWVRLVVVGLGVVWWVFLVGRFFGGGV